MTATRRTRCPSCKQPVKSEGGGRPADYPFCSERCRLLDLHRWLDGQYRIPIAVPDPSPPGESEAD